MTRFTSDPHRYPENVLALAKKAEADAADGGLRRDELLLVERYCTDSAQQHIANEAAKVFLTCRMLTTIWCDSCNRTNPQLLPYDFMNGLPTCS